jgi:ribosome-associated heat shock protein Hsp15
MRIDKWLWAARFFKTRALAIKACDIGRIQANQMDVKPSRELKLGDILRIKNPSGAFEIEVLKLSDQRGPAVVAQTLYRETEQSKQDRELLLEQKKLMPSFEDSREGRPSKRDRRELDRLRSVDDW